MNVTTNSDGATKEHQILASPDEIVTPESPGHAEDGPQLEALARAVGAVTIYLDMLDLIDYVQVNISLSGIQRVVSNLVAGSINYAKSHPNYKIVPVFLNRKTNEILSVETPLVIDMLRELEGAKLDRTGLDTAIRTLYETGKTFEPKSGDYFAIPGAFWIYPNFDQIRPMQERGVKFIVYVHDLIPITNPEFVDDAATRAFRLALVDGLMLADGALTNSEFVADQVREFMRQRTTFELPVMAVPLATELRPISGDKKSLGAKVREIVSEDFVLAVSTIENRKNYVYLVRIWETLLRNHVPNVPHLVFVGKLGWDIRPFIDQLNATDYLGGRLHLLHEVSDYELSELYKHAMFTMYPSFAEGFGLPVGESLGYGKPCLSSNRASMPEVGGKFARYFDPDDVNEGYAEVLRLLSNPQELERWADQIVSEYKPRLWSDFVSDFFDTVAEIDQNAHRAANCVVEPGDIVGMGRNEIARRDGLGKRLTYLSPIRVKGWHGVEDWGCWSSSRRSILKFSTPLPPLTPITLYMFLDVPAGTSADGVSVTAEVGDVMNRLNKFYTSPKWCLLEGKTDDRGDVEIITICAGPFARPDVRELFIGLRALAYCSTKDTEARMTLLERVLVGGL